MVVTPLGTWIVGNAVQPKNAYFSITRSELGMVMLVSDTLPRKASVLITSVPSGTV